MVTINRKSGDLLSAVFGTGALLRLLVGLSLVLAGLTLSSTAVARSAGAVGNGSGLQAGFSLKSSAGDAVYVNGSGGEVVLTVIDGSAIAIYTVAGRVSTRGIWARFGHLGRIAVRFQPSGHFIRQSPSTRCTGKARITRFGVFTGTIRFTGEHGYAKVSALQARGRTHAPWHWRCRPRHGRECTPSGDGPEESVLLGVDSRSQERSFVATANRFPEVPHSTGFFASASEMRGRMRVERFALARGPERTFTFADDLTMATVAPPPPFEGSATFQRNPDHSISWRGSLRVSLPGAPHLALTGPAFDASLKKPVVSSQGAFCATFSTPARIKDRHSRL